MTNTPVTLTAGQQTALDDIYKFLLNPTEEVFVLEGYSGCGKSTLVKELIRLLPGYFKIIEQLVPNYHAPEVTLTATTNKAAEVLAKITGEPTSTVFSALGLTVQTDYKTHATKVIERNYAEQFTNLFLVVDEASYVDPETLQLIFRKCVNCKILFIGDPAQLTQFTIKQAPVFNAGFPTTRLTEIVRQVTNPGEPLHPIIDLSTKFRHTVETGQFFSFVPDGHHIQLLDRDDFNDAVIKEFTRLDWKYADSKVLAWTNKQVIAYNNYIHSMLKGDPSLQVGDYAINNSFATMKGSRFSLKVDQLVEITAMAPASEYGVPGIKYTLDHKITFFMPLSREAKKIKIRQLQLQEAYAQALEISQQWVDLRPAYASTVNKSQGSTFDDVYIDLDDISRCNSGNQIARMLYVAVSRARNRVFLTGDLI